MAAAPWHRDIYGRISWWSGGRPRSLINRDSWDSDHAHGTLDYLTPSVEYEQAGYATLDPYSHAGDPPTGGGVLEGSRISVPL